MNLDLATGEDLAITIASRPAENAGLFVTMFSLHSGKTTCLAAGIRRGNARLCGTMEPINLVAVRIAGQEPATLRDARVIDDFSELKESWRHGRVALHMSDSVNRLTGHGDPQPRIFGLLLNALTELCRQQKEGTPTPFQMKLLKETGLAPMLDQCTSCQGPISQATHYDYERGGATCAKCPTPFTQDGHPITQADLEHLRQLASGQHPENCLAAALIVDRSIAWHSGSQAPTNTPDTQLPQTREKRPPDTLQGNQA